MQNTASDPLECLTESKGLVSKLKQGSRYKSSSPSSFSVRSPNPDDVGSSSDGCDVSGSGALFRVTGGRTSGSTSAAGYTDRNGDSDGAGISSSAPQPTTQPPFWYNIEIQKSELTREMLRKNASEGAESDRSNRRKSSFFPNREKTEKKKDSIFHAPCIYTIILHAPFVLENLLCMGGEFVLVSEASRTVLWRRWLDPGEVVSIHTVSMEESILLSIYLKHCSTGEFGVLVHRPPVRKGDYEGLGYLTSIQRTIGDFIDENFIGLVYDETSMPKNVTLTDTVGQRLRVQIENNLGRGGQRHVLVYTPYWFVNTSQYAIRFRQDGSSALPAGTVTPQRDGSKLLARFTERYAHSGGTQNLDNDDYNNINDYYNGNNNSSGNSNGQLYRSGLGVHSGGAVYNPDGIIGRKGNEQDGPNGRRYTHLDGHVDGAAAITHPAVFDAQQEQQQHNNHYAYPHPNRPNRQQKQYAMGCTGFHSDDTVFFGTAGPLHFSKTKDKFNSEKQRLLRGDISFDKLVSMAYMFNFEDALLNALRTKKVFVQLDDSDWSREPVSLDSVGVHQLVSIMHYERRDRGVLDEGVHAVACIVKQAEGRLAKYTKIVRFTPKFVVVNKLPMSLTLLQPIEVMSSNSNMRKAVDVAPNQSCPFYLPVVFGGREVAYIKYT